ncbi:MAG: HAD family hydrolase [Candidatus Helarchaeota archaeon]
MNDDFSSKKLIVFDFDGTLVDFKIDYLSIRLKIIKYLYSSFNLPQNSFSINDRIFVTLNKAQEYIDKNYFNWNQTLKEVDEIIKTEEWKAARKNSITKKVEETLRKLRANEFKLAIFSLETEEIIKYLLKKSKIEDLIDIIATRDKVKNIKPNPEHLNYILDKLKIFPEQVIVVGDHKIDMECGKNIKALCIGKRSKFCSDSELINCGAKYIIEKISDLISLMNLG